MGMEIQGVDLIKVAQQHLAFLEDVEAVSDGLHQPHVIRNAIRRYETIWLPLLAENPGVSLEAPLDVHWVWHVHMLCPKKYAADCESIIGMIPDHEFFLIKSAKNVARSTAEEKWRKRTIEQFNIDFGSVKENCNDTSKITYDIETASDRQKEFFYNVSLLHFSYTTFLEKALERYKKFVALKKKHRNAFLVPMYDIDLMWHTHQLCPLAYREDMQAYLGYIMDHDDSTTDRSPDSHLSKATTETKTLWTAEYPKDPYFVPGVMYRGKNPRGELDHLTQEEIFGFYQPGFNVTIMKVKLTGNEEILKPKYKICGSFHPIRAFDRSKTPDLHLRYYLKLQKGEFTWDSPLPDGFANFVFKQLYDNQHGHFIEFALNMERRDGIKSYIGLKTPLFGMKYKVTYDRVFKEYMADPSSKKYYFTIEGISKMGLTATVYFCAEMQEGRSKAFHVELGKFESTRRPVPKGVRLGPVPLASVMEAQTSPGAFKVAEHSIKDGQGNVIFTARVIHSTRLRTSVLQVFKGERLLVVSHLIGSEQLPKKDQVGTLANRCITLGRGERAMVIKNASGDWAVVRGKWAGFEKASPPIKKGKPGYLETSIQRGQTVKLATFGVNGYFSLGDLNYTSDTFHISCFCEDIAENCALGLSVCLLYVLCEPRVCPPGIPDLKKPRIRETGTSHKYIVAMGYHVPTPSNPWLYHHHTMGHRWRDEWYDHCCWDGHHEGCIHGGHGEHGEVEPNEGHGSGHHDENSSIAINDVIDTYGGVMCDFAADEFATNGGESVFCPWEGNNQSVGDAGDVGGSLGGDSGGHSSGGGYSSVAETAACGGCTSLMSSTGDSGGGFSDYSSGGGGFSSGSGSGGWVSSGYDSGGGGGSSHDYDSGGHSSSGGGGGCGSSCASSSGGGGGGCGSSCGSSCGGSD